MHELDELVARAVGGTRLAERVEVVSSSPTARHRDPWPQRPVTVAGELAIIIIKVDQKSTMPNQVGRAASRRGFREAAS